MFSLRTLLVVVADNYGVICGFVLLTIGILCWSFLERAIPFWRGLCVFGAVYMLCAFWSPLAAIADKLPSNWLYKIAMLPDDPFAAARMCVSHCIAALLFGFDRRLDLSMAQIKSGGRERKRMSDDATTRSTQSWWKW